jgi:excisionase family DNA binding protein
VDLLTAAKLLGIGRTTAYELARRDQFPCRLLRVGTRYRVVTADLLKLLDPLTYPGPESSDCGAAQTGQ